MHTCAQKFAVMITVALHTHTNGDCAQDATKSSARAQALEDALRKERTRADQGMNVCVHVCMHVHVRAVYIRICILYIHIRICILYVHYAYSTHPYIYKNIHIRTYGYTYINACTVRPYCMYIQCLYISTYVYVRACV